MFTSGIMVGAAAEGMKSLREDGIDKVLLGMTSVEEIARVII